MKKLVLLLSIVSCVIIGAKTLTDLEKKEVLKQFEIFQNVVKNRDFEIVKSMVKFPLNIEAGYAFISDENANFDNGVNEKLFMESKSSVLDMLSGLTNVKINYSKNNLTPYYEEGLTPEEKKRRYYYDENENDYYYKDKNNKKIYGSFCDFSIEGNFLDDGNLEIVSSSFPAKIAPAPSEACDTSTFYWFKLINGKLKLYKVAVVG